MRPGRAYILLIAALLGSLSVAPAQAGLLITNDKTSQRKIVAKDDMPLYDWPVSTGLRGYDTPSGTYQPFRMEADHFSREWDDAPMPHSIFFTQIGHAIHGSFDMRRLGRPASHGCVRLHPDNAAILFKLVRAEKMANTRVVLTGTIPGGPGEIPHKLGVDPYAADEALAGYTPPAPLLADEKEKTREPARAERPHSRPRRAARYYYYYERPQPRNFADFFFGRRN